MFATVWCCGVPNPDFGHHAAMLPASRLHPASSTRSIANRSALPEGSGRGQTERTPAKAVQTEDLARTLKRLAAMVSKRVDKVGEAASHPLCGNASIVSVIKFNLKMGPKDPVQG